MLGTPTLGALFQNGNALILGLSYVLYLLAIAVFIRALLSWVNPDPRNPVVQLLDAITEPILQPLRQVVPRMGGMDLTPMVATILLFFIAGLLQSNA